MKCETSVRFLRAAILPIAHNRMSDTGRCTRIWFFLPVNNSTSSKANASVCLSTLKPYGTAFPWWGRTWST